MTNMRRKIVAGNWKMNLSKMEALELYASIDQSRPQKDVELVVFPPAIYLDALTLMNGKIPIGVQNFHPMEEGAFTGEQSITQVKSLGATYVLIGHSERRMYFSEDSVLLQEKVDAALKHALNPIFCCGEPLSIREINQQAYFVNQQLRESLFHLSSDELMKVVIAYEPIWAIGTGKTATSTQANDMHASIRNCIAEEYGSEVAEKISILYGGSCNATNANELFACEHVDGGLIGGAALQSTDFIQIANSF
jgi:triosephosphate isomerase